LQWQLSGKCGGAVTSLASTTTSERGLVANAAAVLTVLPAVVGASPAPGWTRGGL